MTKITNPTVAAQLADIKDLLQEADDALSAAHHYLSTLHDDTGLTGIDADTMIDNLCNAHLAIEASIGEIEVADFDADESAAIFARAHDEEVAAQTLDRENKVFLGHWGEGYINQESREITFKEITEENGWDFAYIDKLDDLAVGDYANCSDHSGILMIKRIK